MDAPLLFLISVCEPVAIGLIVLILPRVTRKGLLFGVYVGTELARGDEARLITGAWYRGMAVTVILCALTGLALWLVARPFYAFLLPDFMLLVGLTANYLRSHRAARALSRAHVPEVPSPPAVASLEQSEPTLTLPALTLIAGVATGLLAVWYGWSSYDLLPDRMPTHFSGSGTPDAWSKKSFASVMALPLTTLATGAGMGLLALFIARAKRALRLEKEGVSLWAQQKYRTAIVRYVCALTLITVAMLAIMSFGAIRVGLGEAQRLPPIALVLALVLALWAIAGAVYIAVRMGQGGARLEASVAHAPLTDGLADNDKWRLGAIYVNRDDPSMFVEHRFGIGYTINFGNPKAVVFIVVLLAALVAIPIWLSLSQ